MGRRAALTQLGFEKHAGLLTDLGTQLRRAGRVAKSDFNSLLNPDPYAPRIGDLFKQQAGETSGGIRDWARGFGRDLKDWGREDVLPSLHALNLSPHVRLEDMARHPAWQKRQLTPTFDAWLKNDRTDRFARTRPSKLITPEIHAKHAPPLELPPPNRGAKPIRVNEQA